MGEMRKQAAFYSRHGPSVNKNELTTPTQIADKSDNKLKEISIAQK